MLQFYFLIFFGGSFDVTSMKTTKTNDETIGLSLNPKQGSARHNEIYNRKHKMNTIRLYNKIIP